MDYAMSIPITGLYAMSIIWRMLVTSIHSDGPSLCCVDPSSVLTHPYLLDVIRVGVFRADFVHYVAIFIVSSTLKHFHVH